METVIVRWNAELETWYVAELGNGLESESNEWFSFDDWASEQADLSAFRFVLSGENYVCRWITLPGVQPRHLNKALPFALEESFIEDISQYHIVTAGKVGKFTHQIYCGKSDTFERLMEACALHHIQLRQLIPETSLIPDNYLVHHGDYWLINIHEIGEAKIHQSVLITYLEAICAELGERSIESLVVIDRNLDSANLLKMQIETSFSSTIKAIEIQHGGFEQIRNKALENKYTDLLTDQFRPAEVKVEKPTQWWRSAALLAACWALFSFTQTMMENKQIIEQEKQVKEATQNLYAELFPGERIRFLERQINSKIKDGGKKNTAGFMMLLHKTSAVHQQINQQKQIEWKSVRFNERQNLLVIDLTAKSIADIQHFKSAIEKDNLTVEIASATNESNQVKGRIKIGGRT